jgi:hypothetical protein
VSAFDMATDGLPFHCDRTMALRRHRVGVRHVLAACMVAAVISSFAASPQLASAGTPAGWSIITSPSTSPTADDAVLGTTCANALECWAVGITITNINTSSTVAPLVESWNGTSWSLEPNPTFPGGGGGLFGVTCVNGSDCWAVGAVVAGGSGSPTGSLTEHWNGTAWSIVPSPTPVGAQGAFLQGVSCVSASNCWAVGYGTDQNGQNLNSVTEHWDGSAWSIVPGAPTGQTYDQLDSVSCITASNCWAVGNAGPVQQNPNFLPIFPGAVGDQGLIEHWDGGAWSVVPSFTGQNPEGGYLSSVACVSSSDCWASGSTTDGTGMASGTLMENWNGSAWSFVPTPVPPGSAGSILGGVSCLSAAQCWAVGSSGSFGGGGGSGFQPNSFIESWNGSAWSIQPSPNVTSLSFLNSVACLQGTGCWAVGSTATQIQQNDPGLRSLIEQMTLPPAANEGLIMSARDGGVFTFGNSTFYGSMGGQHLNQPVVGMASTPSNGGYWLVASDGGMFSFGNAHFYGSMGGHHLNRPIVGMATTPDGGGYWLVASDGGVFSFGDARFYGSTGGQHLNQPIVGMASTADGGGYWLTAADGGIFSFGDATFYGSTGGDHLNQPISGMATTSNGHGYWLVASDGGIFTFGNASFLGSVPGQGIVSRVPLVGISRTPDGRGYWLVGSDGSVYAYGDAVYLGSLGGTVLAAPISGVASQ